MPRQGISPAGHSSMQETVFLHRGMSKGHVAEVIRMVRAKQTPFADLLLEAMVLPQRGVGNRHSSMT